MTAVRVPAAHVTPAPGSRLDELLAFYAQIKPKFDEIEKQLDAVKAGIKVELAAAAPEGATKIDVEHPALAMPLVLSYIESVRLDTKALKTEAPATYAKYAVKSGKWDLRAAR